MKSDNSYSRKKFLKTLGVGSVSAFLGSSYLLTGCTNRENEAAQMGEAAVNSDALHTASIQLYTFRNQLNEDIRTVIPN